MAVPQLIHITRIERETPIDVLGLGEGCLLSKLRDFVILHMYIIYIFSKAVYPWTDLALTLHRGREWMKTTNYTATFIVESSFAV